MMKIYQEDGQWTLMYDPHIAPIVMLNNSTMHLQYSDTHWINTEFAAGSQRVVKNVNYSVQELGSFIA